VRDARKIFANPTLVTLLVLIGLAGVSQWLRYLVEPQPLRGPERHEPDYTMENFTIKSMGQTGLPEHLMRAITLVHYPDDDTTEFSKPHITVFQEDRAPWQIHADQGWLAGDRKSTLLRGEVLIENPGTSAGRSVHLVTRDLRIVMDDEYAETDQAITIRGKSSIIKGVGMRAHLKEGRLYLLSQVRGSYLPNTATDNP
jgi:lipopolysaccharide export system protein LptC